VIINSCQPAQSIVCELFSNPIAGSVRSNLDGPFSTNDWEPFGDGRRPLLVRRGAVPLMLVFCCVGCGSATALTTLAGTGLGFIGGMVTGNKEDKGSWE
jgi:hypothetical protein